MGLHLNDLIRRGFYAIRMQSSMEAEWARSTPGESGVGKLGFESHVAIPSLPVSGDRNYFESSKGWWSSPNDNKQPTSNFLLLHMLTVCPALSTPMEFVYSRSPHISPL